MIGEVCQVVNGGTPKTNVPNYWGGPHQWITPAEMGGRDTPYVSATERTLTDDGLKNSSARLLPANSLILSTRAPIGYVVINSEAMAFNQGCKGLVPGGSLDPKYLYHYLTSVVDFLKDLGTGATFKELSGGKLKSVPIPVPPLSEQVRIVAILDEAFGRIDVGIANTEANLRNARALREVHLRTALLQQGDGWNNRPLAVLAENLDRMRVPITKANRDTGDIPYYGASGVVDYVADYIFDEDLLLVSEDGANLLARTYPIAFSIAGKSWVNNHAHVLRFPDLITQRFTEYYLNSISLEPFVSGMAQPKLNQKSLNSIPVPLPPLEERGRIVEDLEKMSQESDRLASQLRLKLNLLSELKHSMLEAAFAGRLTAKFADEFVAFA